MTTYFAKYLYDKEMISKKDLIECACDEVEQSPSFLKLIVDSEMMTEDQLISVVCESFESQRPILSLVKEKGYLNNSQIENLIELKKSKSPNLIQILLDHNLIQPEQVDNLVEEFKKQLGSIASETSPALQGTTEQDNDAEISAAALESFKELGIASEEQIKELEKSITPALKMVTASDEVVADAPSEAEVSLAALESLKELGIATDEQLAQLEKNVSVDDPAPGQNELTLDDSLKSYFNLYDDFIFEELIEISRSMIKGIDIDKISLGKDYCLTLAECASEAGLQYSEKIFKTLLKIFNSIETKQIDYTQTSYLKLADLVKQSVVISAKFKDMILITGFETGLLEQEYWKTNFINTMRDFIRILNRK